jgi:hypothetical protein
MPTDINIANKALIIQKKFIFYSPFDISKLFSLSFSFSLSFLLHPLSFSFYFFSPPFPLPPFFPLVSSAMTDGERERIVSRKPPSSSPPPPPPTTTTTSNERTDVSHTRTLAARRRRPRRAAAPLRTSERGQSRAYVAHTSRVGYKKRFFTIK